MGNADCGNEQIVGAHADALVTPLTIEGVCLSDDLQSPTHSLFDHHNGHGLFVGERRRGGPNVGSPRRISVSTSVSKAIMPVARHPACGRLRRRFRAE